MTSHLQPDEMDFDTIGIALERYEERADEIRRTLKHFYTVHENYSQLYSRLQSLQAKSRLPTLIPFGSHAFIPGQIVNCHTLTVYLGEGYYREMTLEDTITLVQKRLTGVQNEILLNHRELTSFGHHISHCYSILGKPMYIPSMVDKVKSKITGKELPKSNLVTINDANNNINGGNNNNNISNNGRVTLTQQGVNEDGEGVFEIIEHLNEDEDPLVFNPKGNNRINRSNQDMDDVQIDPDVPLSDAFYQSLTKTLNAFEADRLQDYNQDEVDELEEIERRLMGDAYVPPVKLQGKNNDNKKEIKTTSTLEPRDTALMLDNIVIPTEFGSDNTNNGPRVNADDLRRELGIGGGVVDVSFDSNAKNQNKKSFILGEVDDVTSQDDDIVNLMKSSNNKKSVVEVVDDNIDAPDYENYFQYLEKNRVQNDSKKESKNDSKNIIPVKNDKNVEKGQNLPDVSKLSSKTTDVKPPTTKPVPTNKQKDDKSSSDSLIRDTIQVRTRPQRGPVAPNGPNVTSNNAALGNNNNNTGIKANDSTTTLQNSKIVTQSGAIIDNPLNNISNNDQEQDEEDEIAAANAYQRYLMSISNTQSNEYFAQFLSYDYDDEDLESIDGLGDEYDDDWDEDEDWDEDGEDEFIQMMKNVYVSPKTAQNNTNNDITNTNNNGKKKSVQFSTQLEDTTTIPANNTTDLDDIDGPAATPEEREYMDMFWDHIQTVVDEGEQEKAKKQAQNKSNNIGFANDPNFPIPTHSQQAQLPAQDRPVYSSFGLATTRDGSHTLIPKSNDSTLYTSSAYTKKSNNNSQLQVGPLDQPSRGGAVVKKEPVITVKEPSAVDGSKQQPTTRLPSNQPQQKISRFKQMRMELNQQQQGDGK